MSHGQLTERFFSCHQIWLFGYGNVRSAWWRQLILLCTITGIVVAGATVSVSLHDSLASHTCNVRQATALAWPFIVFGPFLSTVGLGLYYTVDQSTSFARMGGYQIIAGVGLGGTLQLPVRISYIIFMIEHGSFIDHSSSSHRCSSRTGNT